jgi:hypothetical protein
LQSESVASGYQKHVASTFYLPELALSFYFIPAARGRGEVARTAVTLSHDSLSISMSILLTSTSPKHPRHQSHLRKPFLPNRTRCSEMQLPPKITSCRSPASPRPPTLPASRFGIEPHSLFHLVSTAKRAPSPFPASPASLQHWALTPRTGPRAVPAHPGAAPRMHPCTIPLPSLQIL